MGNLIDLTGQVYGKVHIVKRAPNRNGRVHWYGWCECEIDKPLEERTLKSYSSANLRTGNTTSCGCVHKELTSKNNMVDLTGQQFNDLLVLEYTGSGDGGHALWKVQCKCGNIFICSSRKIKDQKSCRECSCKKLGERFQKDLTNQHFGKLIALEKTDKRKGTYVVWKCKCDCGNIAYVSTNDLTSGHVRSCGCLKESIGEYSIQKLLKDNNINFVQEKTFNSCHFPDTNALARFDFYVNDKYLIEYDGEQHFIKNKDKDWWGRSIKNIQYRDEYKNQWCKENNIPLIRIPYIHLELLCLEDLLLETSTFII